jgi:ABC-type phosphate transport system substrate-binding protein
MRRASRPWRRILAALSALAVFGLAVLGPAPAAQATTYVPINGSGSSWAAPAIDQWSTDMEPQGIHINYDPLGSAAGREAYIDDQVDFAGSDIAFLTTPDPFAGVDSGANNHAYSYIPVVAGGTSFLYNLQVDGKRITNLRLSGQTLAEIFTGHITNWDNPQITHDYGAQLPNLPITVVTRSDGSGASYFLTNWMTQMYPSLWQPFCQASGGPANCGPTEFYPGQHPGFKSLNGSDLVANYIATGSNDGAIGYDEYAYALDYGIPVVNMLNPAGYFVGPTPSNVAIALERAQINENENSLTFLMQNLSQVYTDTDPRAYPLSSYSYLIVPRDSRTLNGKTVGPPSEFSDTKGVTLSTWVNYVLCGAQQTAGQLGYSPLPEPMVKGGFLQDTHIPGAVPPVSLDNYSSCNNPAYDDGVDVLTKDAPYPSPCQKEGAPLNCTVVHGQAVATGGSGPGGGGAGGGGAGGRTSGKGSAGGKGTAGGSGLVNPNTGQVGTGPAAQAADAQPGGLLGHSAQIWLFVVIAGLELLCATAVPSALGGWLRRHGQPGRDNRGPQTGAGR